MSDEILYTDESPLNEGLYFDLRASNLIQEHP